MKLALAVLLFAALAAPVFAQSKKPAGNGKKPAAAAQPNGGAAPAAPQDIANQLDILRKRAQDLIDKAAGNKAASQDEGAKAELRGVVNEINNRTHDGMVALQRKIEAPKGQPAAKADYKAHALPPLPEAGEEGASWKLELAAAQCRADEAGLIADLLRLHASGADAAALKAKNETLDGVVKHRKEAQARMERAAAAAKERAGKAPPKK